jgi:hypothetical protein
VRACAGSSAADISTADFDRVSTGAEHWLVDDGHQLERPTEARQSSAATEPVLASGVLRAELLAAGLAVARWGRRQPCHKF